MTTKKLVLYLYEKIRSVAAEWAVGGAPFIPVARFDDRVPDRPTFWIRLTKYVHPSSGDYKSGDFERETERFLEHLEEQGLIGDLVPLKITINKTAKYYEIEGRKLTLDEGNAGGIAKIMQKVYSDLYTRARRYEAKANQVIRIGLVCHNDYDSSFIIVLKKLDSISTEDFADFANGFFKDIEKDGLVNNDLLPIKVSATLTAYSLALEGKPRMIGENHKFIAKTYQTQDSNSRQRGVQQTSTSTSCPHTGPIGLSLATISESAEQLLSALLRELVVNFKYAEEEHYQDHSKTPPYDLNVVSNSGKVAINMIFKNPIFADPSSNRSRVLMVAAKMILQNRSFE